MADSAKANWLNAYDEKGRYAQVCSKGTILLALHNCVQLVLLICSNIKVVIRFDYSQRLN